MPTVVLPIPQTDFDPTETGVPWQILTQSGVDVRFATPRAQPATADPRMLTGEGLWPWAWVLRADANGVRAYDAMRASEAFQKPMAWEDIRASELDGIVLPGGHAPGMKPYLESPVLQAVIPEFFQASKLVSAICHGVVLLARCKSANGRSVLAGRRVTALLRSQEMTAWTLTRMRLGDYYRTYPEPVQDEVTRHLGDPSFFIAGPTPMRRDAPTRLNAGFVVEDGQLITARWPGDAHRFSTAVARRLQPSTNVAERPEAAHP